MIYARHFILLGGQLLEELSDNYVYSFFYDKPISATKERWSVKCLEVFL